MSQRPNAVKAAAPTLALAAVATALLVASAFVPVSDAQAQSLRARRATTPAPTTQRTSGRVAGVGGNASASAQSARLAALADEYLKGHYAFNPSLATAAGLHQFDAELEPRSREAVAREARRLRATLAELARVRDWLLTAESRYDLLALQAHARARLIEIEQERAWERDPARYTRAAAEAVGNVLKRDYAPAEARLDAVLARERQIARLLAEARANVSNPSRLHVEAAIDATRGAVVFFTRDVPQLIERAAGGRLSAARRAEIDATNSAAAEALRAHLAWLEQDLLPRATGDFRLGPELLRLKLAQGELIEASVEQLLREGELRLRATQESMRAVADEYAPGRGVANALAALAREHPSAEGLIGEARAELDRARAFVRVREIQTPPAREEALTVAEMPPYARSVDFLAVDVPGAAERNAGESFYYVTPPGASLEARARAEHLSFYHSSALPLLAVHAAYPGRYYQMLAARNSPSRVRSALASAAFAEGWAHYAEEMMLDEGFGGGDPRLRLTQLARESLALARHLAALRMHAGSMSFEEAAEFVAREAYQPRAVAERAARQAALEPLCATDVIGKREIKSMRDEWRRQMGDSFRLGDFHDRLLSYGAPPLRVVRLALLGDAARRSAAAMPSARANSPVGAALSESVEFSVLASGQMSEYEGGPLVELVTDETAWRRAWALIGGGRVAPEVNFNTRGVIVVFMGQRSTGGHGVFIDEIRRTGTVLAVNVRERRPAPAEMTTQVITSPFVAVTILRPPPSATVRVAAKADGEQTTVDGKATTPAAQRPANRRAPTRRINRRRGARRRP